MYYATQFSNVRGRTRDVKPSKLKPFDLKVGDTIRATTDSVKGGKFIVTEIKDHIFLTRRNATLGDYTEAFLKTDYQIGRVKRVNA